MIEKASSSDMVLAYDIGGTKVAVAVVDGKGEIREEVRVPIRMNEGKDAVIKQLGDLGLQLLKHYPNCHAVGVASAGPLHPEKGVLLDPTNFYTDPEKTWGEVPISRLLSNRLKRPVYLENDAAAAILAECWKGKARSYRNAMILTLGTGLGTGTVIEKQLVRAGHGLHTESGHIIVKHGDASAPCGCGNVGCAEAYLSGKNFASRFRNRFKTAALEAKEIAQLAREGNKEAREAFREYAELMAITLQNYVVIFAPEIFVFTGSFAAAADLFIEPARRRLEQLLVRRREGIDMMPKLDVSSLENEAGVLGGAYVAFTRHPAAELKQKEPKKPKKIKKTTSSKSRRKRAR